MSRRDALVLVADDDNSSSSAIEKMLAKDGHRCLRARNGQEALRLFWDERPDLIILDVMMPLLDGFQVCERIREHDRATPVLFLTAKGDIVDKRIGYGIGGDDYLVKPFAFDELLARLRVMTRRASASVSDVFTVADLTVDCAARTVSRGGVPVALSSKEFAILEYLVRNRGIVLSREKISHHVWNYDYEGGSNVVDVYIRYLRKKLDDGFSKKLLHTVRGAGYVLREEP